MALFRDLNFAEQRAVQGEANRLQGIALSTLNEVVKVALSFLTVALLAAVIVLMMAGAHFAYNSALFVTSLVVLMVGLLCVGTLIAVNHQTEPPRDSRRLHFLRGWSNGKTKPIFSGSA